MRAFVGGDPVRAHMVILHACVCGDPVRACMGIVHACVDLVHACTGSGMHGGDSMHAGIRYGCGDPVGMGRGSIPCMKAWEPACNVFPMKKVINKKKK